MKKILLATSALIAVSAFAPAHAAMEVTVGGYTSFQAAAYNDNSTMSAHRDFQSESQIIVDANATADNGLKYGAHIALDTSTSDSVNSDEQSIYVAGSFGRVEMGDDDGAAAMQIFAPTVGIGQINGSYDDYIAVAARGHDLNIRGGTSITASNTGDNTKVTYYTPKVAGFQAGVSYAPEAQVGETVALAHTAVKDSMEFGLGYEGEVTGVSVKAGAVYNIGNAAATEDLKSWGVGAQMGYNGFTFGGGYTDNSDSLAALGTASDKSSNWTVGATYEQGAWGVGLSYIAMDFDTNGVSAGSTTGGDYTATVVGASYKVAPGLTVGSDVAFYDRNANGTANDRDGYVALVDVTAAF